MKRFAEAAEKIAATTKKLQKTAVLGQYFKTIPVDEAAVAAVFFSGRPFPAWEETRLQVGGSLLWQIVADLSGKSEHELTIAYRKLGDLGAVTGAVLPINPTEDRSHSGLGDEEFPPSAVQRTFREIAAARGARAKGAIVRQLLTRVCPPEAKYLVKIMTGDLRIGLKESLVEEAIAKAYEAPLAKVQRANMLLGDLGETLRRAAEDRLSEARMRLFHPIGFMLASPAESAEDALDYFQNAWVEDKYDGIRAQAHCSGGTARFFSRTRDEITESFPELADGFTGLPEDAILDGEIVAWSYRIELEVPNEEILPEERKSDAFAPGEASAAKTGFRTGRALPFKALQQRLGRKRVSEKLMQLVPVVYVVFDVLYAGDQLLIEQPLRDRAQKLDELLAPLSADIYHRDPETQKKAGTAQRRFEFGPLSSPLRTADDQEPGRDFDTTDELRQVTAEQEPRARILRAPVFRASSPQELSALFDAAQARGNEGLMIKDPESSYTPGRRGKSWLKLKRELATLDVVVTAVEYGHGKRIGVLSDYTFAVRDGERLRNVGKAYSGLTDAEIAEMTKWFFDHTTEDLGFRRVVEPKIVLEVAFNNVMRSDRHHSGYALRFPRIVRLRPDKLPEEADTLERVKEIFEKQLGENILHS
jgi:DNA ligase 1